MAPHAAPMIAGAALPFRCHECMPERSTFTASERATRFLLRSRLELIQMSEESCTEISGSSTGAGLVVFVERNVKQGAALSHTSSSTLLQMKTDAGSIFSSTTAGIEGTALMVGGGALLLHGCFEVEWAWPHMPQL